MKQTIAMIIEIQDGFTLGEISDAFSAAFPFLSIVFYKNKHGWGEPSSGHQQLSPGTKIVAVRTSHSPGSMEIHGWHSTGVVEQEFGKLFGLHIQVFRREGNALVQTVTTDSRTLEQQNEAARNASLELLDGTDNHFNNENPGKA